MSDKKTKGAMIGAALLMGTGAIGPGFLNNTAQLTDQLKGSFGFVILVTILLAIVVQLNVWRVIGVSGLRGQDVANKVLPGLGYVLAVIIALGGLTFNIGNIGGASLGLNNLFGINTTIGYFITAGIGIFIFLVKDALKGIDALNKVLGGLMILLIIAVIVLVQPPLGLAARETVLPRVGDFGFETFFYAIMTLLGGTVGGYITFAGAHRLIDSGVTGKDNLKTINKSSLMGIGVATIVRVLLFLAILGVVVTGVVLSPTNMAGDAFRQGAGQLGLRFFGLVMFSAGITSVVGAAYTSVSFLKTLNKVIANHEKATTVIFIAISTFIMVVLGAAPQNVLMLAGALNGFILPISLGVCLWASCKKSIMGEDYKHPKWLFVLGILTALLTVYMSIRAVPGLISYFRG